MLRSLKIIVPIFLAFVLAISVSATAYSESPLDLEAVFRGMDIEV